MKKNKFTLASGILLIIFACYSVICAISMLKLIITISIVNPFTFTTESYQTDSLALITIFYYAIYIFLYILQTVAFLITGIKLIRKSSKYNFEDCKVLIVTTLILVSLSFLFDLLSVSGLIPIAIVVLLSCSLVRGTQDNYVENLQVEKVENVTNDKEKENNDNLQQLQKEKEIESSTLLNETSTNKNDIYVERLISLKTLKSKSLITEEEYKILSDNLLQSMAEDMAKKNTKKHKKDGDL